MLEYFTYKKVKKHQEEKKQKQRSEVLTPDDEQFLQRIISEEGPPPPLPERPIRPEAGDPSQNALQLVLYDDGDSEISDSDVSEIIDETRDKGAPGASAEREMSRGNTSVDDGADKKKSRWSFLQRAGSKMEKRSNSKSDKKRGKEARPVTPNEARKEEQDITEVLDNLNLAAEGNKVFSLSKESTVLVQKFTVVLKDLVNGVPTAYDDLVHLLDDSQGQLQKAFNHLPPFLQKLVKSLPKKLSSTLAPEILATAAEAQGMGSGSGPEKKSGFRIPSLKDMVTKPGAVVGILKSIMNVLKLRWPAFIGTNVLWSLGLFVLLFVFWYCHKRGREVRLSKENAATEEELAAMEREVGDGGQRRVELEVEEMAPDDAGAGGERVPAGVSSIPPPYASQKPQAS
ncbi:MAG: hypothetical protein M4579_005681 [Chaenotheca gracillima]|nr:MAG: hypothetical protein M4579_005681 [Chaenotheca gracillima]